MRPLQVSRLLLIGIAVSAGCTDPSTRPRDLHASLVAVPALDDAVLAGQLLAFASDRDGTGFQVFVMQANGTKPMQLTAVPGYNARPNWSHDGRRITFTACHATDQSCDIYVMNADGSAPINLTHNLATEQMSVWSPDDRRIAFVSDRDGSPQIYVMNADGSNPVRLTFDGAVDLLPTWSPDGSRIAFETNRDGNSEVYVMNADGSNPLNLTQNPATDGNPAWSPRGDQIAFRSDRDGNGEIYVMNVDGSHQTRLTDNPAEEYYPAWSPTGARLAFVSNRDGNFEIYVMKPDGSLQTRVTTNAAFDADPAWAITLTAPPAASTGPSATGDAHILIFGGTTPEHFEFSAVTSGTGSVSGAFQLFTDQAGGITVHGPVTCLGVSGNVARIGGVITGSSDAAFGGAPVLWEVVDNGEGPSAPPDQTSDFLAPGSADLVATFCATGALPFPFALFDVQQGNIQVHP